MISGRFRSVETGLFPARLRPGCKTGTVADNHCTGRDIPAGDAAHRPKDLPDRTDRRHQSSNDEPHERGLGSHRPGSGIGFLGARAHSLSSGRSGEIQLVRCMEGSAGFTAVSGSSTANPGDRTSGSISPHRPELRSKHRPAGWSAWLTRECSTPEKRVIIDHGSGLSSSFLHLQEIWVSPGETVSKGQADRHGRRHRPGDRPAPRLANQLVRSAARSGPAGPAHVSTVTDHACNFL